MLFIYNGLPPMFVSDFPHSHACPRHNDALRMNDHPHDRGVYSEHPDCMSDCLQDMLLQLRLHHLILHRTVLFPQQQVQPGSSTDATTDQNIYIC